MHFYFIDSLGRVEVEENNFSLEGTFDEDIDLHLVFCVPESVDFVILLVVRGKGDLFEG